MMLLLKMLWLFYVKHGKMLRTNILVNFNTRF